MWQISINSRFLKNKISQRTILLFCFLTFIAYQAVSYHTLRNFSVIVEKAPELPERYVEPYEVKSHSYRFRNSTKMHAGFTKEEHELVMDLFRQITRLFGMNGITWMINDAASMGSMRHWDLIPWDDDVDILVDFKDFEKVVRILETSDLVNEFNYLDWFRTRQKGIHNEVIKMFSGNSPAPKWFSSNKMYKFPFIDVFFYNKNNTHMWYMEDTYDRAKGQTWRGYNYFKLEDVFPLHLRPLGKYWLPFKKNTEEYLNKKHPGASFRQFCFSSFWSHRDESPQKITSILRCSDLKPDYAFAYPECSGQTCIESLKENGRTIAQIEIKNHDPNPESEYIF